MDASRDPKRLKFLFNACSLNKILLSYWIENVPEFYDEVSQMDRSSVDDKSILAVMEKVYALKSNAENVVFSFQSARKSIRRLREAIEKKEGSDT